MHYSNSLSGNLILAYIFVNEIFFTNFLLFTAIFLWKEFMNLLFSSNTLSMINFIVINSKAIILKINYYYYYY